MPDQPAPDETPGEEPSRAGRSGSLLDDFGTLIEDGKTYAEAELGYQKSRLAYAAIRAQRVAILCGLLAVLMAGALFALVIGALMSLIPSLGPWGATGVVFGVLALCIIVLLAVVRSQYRALFQPFGEKRG